MEIETSAVIYLATTLYDITPVDSSIKQLCGYDDWNFSFVGLLDGQKYVLKIVNEGSSNSSLTDIIDEVLDSAHMHTYDNENSLFRVAKLIRTNADRLSSLVSVILNKENGDLSGRRNSYCNVKLFKYLEGPTLFDYVNTNIGKIELDELYLCLGSLANDLFVFMKSQTHLLHKLKENRRNFHWQLSTCERHVFDLANELFEDESNERRKLIGSVLNEFKNVENEFRNLPEYVLHGDLCGKNIILNEGKSRSFSLIDFQDLQVGPRVVDVAMLILYCVLEIEVCDFRIMLDKVFKLIVKGYQSRNRVYALTSEEIKLLPTLMKLRLSQSLLNGLKANRENPKNKDYVMITNRRGWSLLELMMTDDKSL